MINLDGNYLEGGGQIVRNALALSIITGKAFSVIDIRKGRTVSGLKPQHLHCVKILKDMSSSKVDGDELGSDKLKFYPLDFQGKTINTDIGTAGSISLLLQAVLLPSLFSEKKIRLKIGGGTDVHWSMPFDYFTNVFLPQVRRFANVEVDLIKRGHYPKGGGQIEARIKPKYPLNEFDNFADFLKSLKEDVKPYDLVKRPELHQIKCISHATKDLAGAEVSERQSKAAEFLLRKYNVPVDIRNEYCESNSTGSGITLYAVFSEDQIERPVILGADAIGERGKKAEIVGKEAAMNLIKQVDSGACVDEHMADNLVPFMGLLPNSKIKVSSVTDHCKTNIYVTEKFLPIKFKITGQLIESFEI